MVEMKIFRKRRITSEALILRVVRFSFTTGHFSNQVKSFGMAGPAYVKVELRHSKISFIGWWINVTKFVLDFFLKKIINYLMNDILIIWYYI